MDNINEVKLRLEMFNNVQAKLELMQDWLLDIEKIQKNHNKLLAEILKELEVRKGITPERIIEGGM